MLHACFHVLAFVKYSTKSVQDQPETVAVGRHALVIVLEENHADKKIAVANTNSLMQFAGSVTAFNGVDGVEYQKKVRSEWN